MIGSSPVIVEPFDEKSTIMLSRTLDKRENKHKRRINVRHQQDKKKKKTSRQKTIQKTRHKTRHTTRQKTRQKQDTRA
jgi:hypothetical protein